MIKASSFALPALVLLGLSFFVLPVPDASRMDERMDPVLAAFPAQIGDWRGSDEPLDEKTYEILETRNVLSRRYENGRGAQMHLLLVASDRERRVAHPPEVCYTSSNYALTGQAERAVAGPGGNPVTVRQFTAQSEKNPGDRQRVTYLYKVGGRYTPSYYEQQLQFAFDRLSRRESRIMLIRVAELSAKPKLESRQAEEFLAAALSKLS